MKRWQIIIGIILLLLGLSSLLNLVFPNLRIGRFFFPLFLIGLGIVLLLRPRMTGSHILLEYPIIGDLRKIGQWEVSQHEFWLIVGSSRFDFSEAQFLSDQASIRVIGFVADIKVIVPDDVGLLVESSSIVTDYSGLQGKQDRFLSTLEDQTPNYQTAEKRVKIQTIAFVSDIKVRSSM